MDTIKFKETYNESRNGCISFIRHPLVRSVAMSDGVHDLANTGCWWLLDILATELPAKFKQNAEVSNTCMIIINVHKGKARLSAEFTDGVEAWKRAGIWTDLPEGKWLLYMSDEGEGPTPYRIILLSEY